jgi:hypothetical protein
MNELLKMFYCTYYSHVFTVPTGLSTQFSNNATRGALIEAIVPSYFFLSFYILRDSGRNRTEVVTHVGW